MLVEYLCLHLAYLSAMCTDGVTYGIKHMHHDQGPRMRKYARCMYGDRTTFCHSLPTSELLGILLSQHTVSSKVYVWAASWT